MQVGWQSTGTTPSCVDPLIVVSEDDAENATVICSRQTRLSAVYLSTSNCVRLLLNTTVVRTAEFLIRYEGLCKTTPLTGCEIVRTVGLKTADFSTKSEVKIRGS